LATDEIWFYEHVLPEGVKNYTRTRPMQFEEFQPILDWWDNRAENERAWKVRAAGVAPPVLRTPSPNTTMKTLNAYSAADSSDLGRAGEGLMPSVLDKAFKGEL
jgi:type I restriction enzyme M protein